MVFKQGDILLYYRPPTFLTKLITFGEILEDGKQKREYYHVAVVVDSEHKVEANGKNVSIAPIHNGGVFDAYRLNSVYQNKIPYAIEQVISYVGQPYDYLLIFGLAIEYISFGWARFPKHILKHSEEKSKICSTLAQQFLWYCGIPPIKDFDSPEDVYLTILDKSDKIYTGS